MDSETFAFDQLREHAELPAGVFHFGGNCLNPRPVVRSQTRHDVVLGALDIEFEQFDPVHVIFFDQTGERDDSAIDFLPGFK